MYQVYPPSDGASLPLVLPPSLSLTPAATDYIAFGLLPATAGFVRFSQSTTQIESRNAGNTANAILMGLSGADVLTLGGANTLGVNLSVNGVTKLSLAAAAGDQASFGTDPATTGAIRLSVGSEIRSKSLAGNNAFLMGMLNTNDLYLGGITATDPVNVQIRVATGNSIFLVSNATNMMRLSATGSDFLHLGANATAGGTLGFGSSAGQTITYRNTANTQTNTLVSWSDVTINFGLSSNTGITSMNLNGPSGVLHRAFSGATEVYRLGLSAADQISFGTTPATLGYVRLPNNAAIRGRNLANTANADVLAWGSGGTDIIGIGDTTVPITISMATNAAGNGLIYSRGANVLLQLRENAADVIRFGVTPATGGNIRLATGGSIRAPAGSAMILGTDTITDILRVEDVAGVALVSVRGASTGTATTGASGALPALPDGYFTININGTSKKIAYYNP